MTLLFVFIFLSVFVSFLCSLLESVLLSVSPAYIAVRVQKGHPSGLILNKLKSEIDRPLAAILTLNTIAHTIGAAGVGAQVIKIWGDEKMALASAILTFVILIFSEIIPKTVGASHWKTLASPAAYVIRLLIWILYPIVFLTELISDLIGGEETHKMTREEMIVTAEMGVTQGTLRKKESAIIKNLLMLDNIFVHDIMTPRSVLMALEEGETVETVTKKHRPIRYSRIPVFHEDLDHIKGMVHRYQILQALGNDEDDKKIGDMTVPIHSIPEDISVSAVLDQLIHRSEHVFLVIDEYGSTTGIVTLEDAIETLLGVEIVDEFDSVADLREYALEQWKKRKKERNTTTP